MKVISPAVSVAAVIALVTGCAQRETALSGRDAGADTPSVPILHALHNLHPLTPTRHTRALPHSDAPIDVLKALGVKTIISVDGATPDLARAEARGMRYVHIPVTYAAVTPAQRVELARAVRDLSTDGPVFLHCHHGKHRGPAAAASAAIALGHITPDQGVAFMKTAGTAPNYSGLYACVAASTPASASELAVAPADFPSIRRAQGIVAAMVEVDHAYEHLSTIRAARWRVPPDHPDLVPAAEAGRLTDNLRLSHQDPKATTLGPDHLKKLAAAIDEAGSLEEALVRGAPNSELEAAFKLVQASCKDCHSVYRDRHN